MASPFFFFVGFLRPGRIWRQDGSVIESPLAIVPPLFTFA